MGDAKLPTPPQCVIFVWILCLRHLFLWQGLFHQVLLWSLFVTKSQPSCVVALNSMLWKSANMSGVLCRSNLQNARFHFVRESRWWQLQCWYYRFCLILNDTDHLFRNMCIWFPGIRRFQCRGVPTCNG